MTIADTDARTATTFRGHHDGVRFACLPHRYGKGMVLTLENDVPQEWKTRAAWLAEALGGKWARGHHRGYRIAPSRATLWRALFLAGWDANVPLFGGRSGVRFYRPGQMGSENGLMLKEVLAIVGTHLTSPAASQGPSCSAAVSIPTPQPCELTRPAGLPARSGSVPSCA